MATPNPSEDARQRLAAATRALAEAPLLSIEFSSHPRNAKNKLVLPPPPAGDRPAERNPWRGKGDMAALSLRYHNATLHQQLRPKDGLAAQCFDAMEQARIQWMGARHMAGVRANLAARIAKDESLQNLIRQEAATLENIAASVGLAVREILLPGDLSGAVARFASPWQGEIARKAKTLPEKLVHAESQTAFAALSLELIDTLELYSNQRHSQHLPPEELDAGEEPESGQQEMEETIRAPGSVEQAVRMELRLAPTGAEGSGMEPDDQEEAAGPARQHHDPTTFMPAPPYHPFTTRYDEVVPASQLASSAEIEQLYTTLEQKLSQFQALTTKLAGRLQRFLMARQARHWRFDEEDGVIDSRRMARVIARPDITQIYKREEQADFRDTVVTLLIDNSGSMRGRPITLAAISASILARTLERCGVSCEILGFTTREWKGGNSHKQWVQAGRPPSPGRLNDLRHIIYKPADTPWRKARKSMAVMLKDGLLKENIDGEAILWACDRLLARPEERRILMVISDGAPVDDSTLSLNPGNYLDQHLRDVIAYVEDKMPIELLAIGIGHDVTRYYSHAVTLTDIERLGETMSKELSLLFGAQEKKKRP